MIVLGDLQLAGNLTDLNGNLLIPSGSVPLSIFKREFASTDLTDGSITILFENESGSSIDVNIYMIQIYQEYDDVSGGSGYSLVVPNEAKIYGSSINLNLTDDGNSQYILYALGSLPIESGE
jgi:hypothetical protein